MNTPKPYVAAHTLLIANPNLRIDFCGTRDPKDVEDAIYSTVNNALRLCRDGHMHFACWLVINPTILVQAGEHLAEILQEIVRSRVDIRFDRPFMSRQFVIMLLAAKVKGYDLGGFTMIDLLEIFQRTHCNGERESFEQFCEAISEEFSDG